MSTQKFNRELAVELENQSLEMIKETSEIYNLTDEERQAFIDMAMPTYKNFEEKIGKELLDNALAKIKEIESN